MRNEVSKSEHFSPEKKVCRDTPRNVDGWGREHLQGIEMTETEQTEHLETPTLRVTVVNFAHVRCFISFVTVSGLVLGGGSYRGITPN